MSLRSRTTTLNISLPEVLKHYVQEVVKDEGYQSASEFIRHLLREDMGLAVCENCREDKPLAKMRADSEGVWLCAPCWAACFEGAS